MGSVLVIHLFSSFSMIFVQVWWMEKIHEWEFHHLVCQRVLNLVKLLNNGFSENGCSPYIKGELGPGACRGRFFLLRIVWPFFSKNDCNKFGCKMPRTLSEPWWSGSKLKLSWFFSGWCWAKVRFLGKSWCQEVRSMVWLASWPSSRPKGRESLRATTESCGICILRCFRQEKVWVCSQPQLICYVVWLCSSYIQVRALGAGHRRR